MLSNNLKKSILSVCAIALLAGCSSKDVEYEDASSTSGSDTTIGQSVDGKTGNISGVDERVVSNSFGESLKTLTHDGIHNVESDIDGNVVVLESIHFAFDKYNLSDEMREVATTNYNKIDKTRQVYSSVKVKLEGNCDEWGTDEYNYALGLKRAKTAKDALVSDGMNPDNILMVSFGESNPVCTQRNTTCWKMNRRVDYRLLP